MEIKILQDGNIIVGRSTDKTINNIAIDLIKTLTNDSDEIKRIKEFFDEGERIKVLFGDKIMCG